MPPSKYLLTPPDDLHPLTDSEQPIYPDFDPWVHTREEDKVLNEFVAKGYYTASKVNFETISARSALQGSLPKISSLLGEELSKIIQIREEEINKIGTFDSDESARFTKWAGQDYHLPNRVTLTDQKRNLWLQELSSSSSSLQSLTKSVPHGFRKRYILEQCYIQFVPIYRFIWLIKSCYAIEWKGMVSKAKGEISSDELLRTLYKDWTDSMVVVLEKLVFEVTKYYNDPSQLKLWKLRIAHYLKMLGSCYERELLNKNAMHQWIVDFVSKVESFEFYPMALHILSIFWNGILGTTEEDAETESSFLVIKLSEILLRKYHIVSESKCMINDSKYIINDIQRNSRLKESVLQRLKQFIAHIFHTQSLEAFIMPKQNWNIYKNYLYHILLQNVPERDAQKLKKKLKLISYRNESLRLGSLDMEPSRESSPYNSELALEDVFSGSILNLKNVNPELLSMLDSGLSGSEWGVFVDQKITRMEQVIEIILWSINPSKKHRYDSCHLVAKILVLKMNSQESFQEYGIEDVIWSLIFHFSKLSKLELRKTVWLPKLHQLLNVFIGYGIIKVPTYIRRLISSGVLYLPESENKNFHCKLLINLKISPVMKSQYNMVLKNVSEYAPHFYQQYNFDELVSVFESLKVKLLNGDFEGLEKYPGSIRIMCSEWYLSQICFNQGEMQKIDKKKIIDTFNLFCNTLGELHHFFGWAEYIVYHQLIDDLEILEVFTDILLYLDKAFLLLINDPILFMKTLLHSYTRDLKNKDKAAFELLSYKNFWKFFVKNCSNIIEMDSALQSLIAEVFEIERTKKEKFMKTPSESLAVFLELTGNKHTKLEDQNFPSVIQQNIKKLLHNPEDESTSRKILLLCKASNSTEYNKFLSIFVKRGDFTADELVKLISLRLLSFEVIQKTSHDDILCELVSENNFTYGLNFENEKNAFIRRNFKYVCLQLFPNPQYRQTLVKLLVEYGPNSSFTEKSASVVSHILMEENNMSIIREILLYGMNIQNDPTDNVMDLYQYLNFTNTWLFQILTEFNVNHSESESLSSFFSNIVKTIGCNSLLPKIFSNISDSSSVFTMLTVIEGQFLSKVLDTDKSSMTFLQIMMDTEIVLSRQHINVMTLEMDSSVLELFKERISQFAKMSSDELKQYDENLNELLKMVITHEKFILRHCFESVKLRDTSMIENFYILFQKTSKDLKLKLLLYDLLTSLKSYILDGMKEQSSANIKMPAVLTNLPKFAISSFLGSENSDEDFVERDQPELIHLGLYDAENKKASNKKYFVFNKKTSQFDSAFRIEPFQYLVNYQEPLEGCLNNTSLSLGLFDARLEKTNPS
ncbi:mediator of RNA polymerase II transcription subunit 12 [Kluyveromyces marxianus]|uniref:Mediator of RNA polymerase II transcription subunit 12 n=2 Tax=Kluyveromyces marxianus TaxID=4911 RepID=W0T5H3_KLUMD|nr:mediator of RNA polymerase II transcription subunit 12 [Kluyveromyces marxianus DMKU3-1042]QGN14594.1 mediator of RNA polymerase II transcription subunit 12 [Kluyveromyces marxianus]BAO38857.1 mediator of RNA polymerase II transcription subunit 12 [Kluyveromyces marxianus DMKU3-1042]